MNLLFGVFEETYRIVLDSGVFILLGFFLAGVLHEFVDTARIGRMLGGRDLKSILTAALVGAPLPLCSCGVLPTAVALRKKGASRESTVSFLISTPETGVDSVLITYGLLGPVMALVRPLAAVATAVAAGLLSLLAGGRDGGPEPEDEAGSAPPGNAAPACEDGCGPPAIEEEPPRAGLKERLVRIGRYAFVTMMDELAFWLLLAFVATGLLAALLPPDFFLRFLPWPLLSMVVMAIVGVPTYVCASASTPIAAAMIGKGLDPGAALVFMLTGPATNASTIAVVARMFGRRFVALYLGAIFGVAIGAGLLLNAVVGAGLVPAPVAPEVQARGAWALVRFLGAFGFLALMAFSLHRRGLRAGWTELKEHGRALRGLVSQHHDERPVPPIARDCRRERPRAPLAPERLPRRPPRRDGAREDSRKGDVRRTRSRAPPRSPVPVRRSGGRFDRTSPLCRGRLPLSRRGGRFHVAHVPRVRPGAVVPDPRGGAVPHG